MNPNAQAPIRVEPNALIRANPNASESFGGNGHAASIRPMAAARTEWVRGDDGGGDREEDRDDGEEEGAEGTPLFHILRLMAP